MPPRPHSHASLPVPARRPFGRRIRSHGVLFLLLILFAATLSTSSRGDDWIDPILGPEIHFDEIQEVEAVGDRVYVFSIAGVSLLDLGEPAAPQVLGIWPQEGDPPLDNRLYRGSVASDLVLGGGRSAGLRIIDFGDEAAPVLLATVGSEGMFYEGAALAPAGNILYATRHADGVEILDISDPSQPVFLAEVTSLVNSWDLVLRGDRAFVADGTGGLAVLDVSQPASPAHLYSLPLPGAAVDIVLAGDLALVACGSAGLEILDIGDPDDIHWLGNYDSPGLASQLEVDGERVWLADWHTLEVVDLSVPESPGRLGWERPPTRVMGLATNGDLIYMGDWDHFLVYEFGPTPGGDIDLPLRGIKFGEVPVGSSADRTFPIFNTGGGALLVENILSFNPHFEILPPASFLLGPEESREVTIRFTPVAPGYDGTFIRVDSDDPDEEQEIFPAAADDHPGYLELGEEAPDFTLVDMNGVSHTLSDYRGQVVVLAFFADK